MNKKAKRKSSFQKFANIFKQADQFGETKLFSIDGSDSYQSCCGSLLSLVIFGILMTYAIMKGIILLKKEDFKVQEQLVRNGLDTGRIFSQEEIGFKVFFIINRLTIEPDRWE